MWSQPERAQELGRERARLGAELAEMDRARDALRSALELLDLAESENDDSTVSDLERETH